LGRFVLICTGVWLHAADALVMATIVPSVVDDIGGISYVSWTISLYQIGAIAAGAATARLCLRSGVKSVLIEAALVYGSGCVIAAVAPSMAVLLAARLVQGIGGGMLVSLSYIAIQQSFGERLWNRLFGIVAAIWGAGSLLGPLIGGVFADLGAWRLAFWSFALQASLLGAAASLLLAGEQPERGPPAPISPFPVLVLAVAALIIAHAGVAEHGIVSFGECLVGVGLLYLALWLDHRSVEKLLPTQVLAVGHPLSAGLLMVFVLSMATTGFWAYGPLLLKILFGTEPLVSGYILAGEALAWTAATFAVSSATVSASAMLIRLGAACVTAGAAGFIVAVPIGSLWGIILCCLLQGVGFGLFWPSLVHKIVRLADPDERTLAAAAPGTVQRLGSAIGAAATGIAANTSGLGYGISVSAAKAAAFWVFAGFLPFLAVAMIAAFLFTKAPADRPVSPEAQGR
jgi:MFS family permease